MTVKAVLYGVGPIGALIGRAAIHKGVEIVGAIDIDPVKTGKDLGAVIGLDEKTGIRVNEDADAVLSKAKPDVVLHATGSFLDKVYPQLVKAITYGANVVSTCETLAYPYYRYPQLAEKLDGYARSKKVSVLGCGINPGFILDLLPSVMTLPLVELKGISARRSLNASRRRLSFQRKIGLGLDLGEWNRLISQGKITGHVGYAESVHLMAAALGLRIREVEERQEPIIAEKDVSAHGLSIRKGSVAGVKGVGRGICENGVEVIVELIASVDAEDYEEIALLGEPEIRWRSNGIPGDIATAAVVVNMIPSVLEADPGLITISDLVPSWRIMKGSVAPSKL